MNAHILVARKWFLLILLLLASPSWAALVQEEEEPAVLVTNMPTKGTFFLLGQARPAPYPFDPYFGLLPIYSLSGTGGVYWVDNRGDTISEQMFQFEQEGGFGMALMSSPSPPGVAGTNSGVTNLFCTSLTNFTVGYQSWTSSNLALGISLVSNCVIALTIQTSNTSALYDLYGTTNLVALALPQLSRTNWQWLLRASNTVISFGWGNTNWCERYFQLGTMLDTDGDGLTDAYEKLVSHTRPDLWDTDGDGMPDGWELTSGLNPLVNDADGDLDGDGISNYDEWRYGLNPTLDDAQQSGLWQQFRYDARGRLTDLFAPGRRQFSSDSEGNIITITIY